MISDRFKYAMLMASLPPHKRDLFAAKQTPISQIQLEKRLRWLEPQDAEDLNKIQSLLYWSKMTEVNDEDYIAETLAELDRIHNDFFRQVICWRLELRTLVAAMRKRHQGMVIPPEKAALGFGRWTLFIRNNWEQRDFGIGRQLPWLDEVERLLNGGDSLALEKFLLNLVWQHYEQQGNGHYFDFEAVIIYVLRWDVINRWNLYHERQAVDRFSTILDDRLQGVLNRF